MRQVWCGACPDPRAESEVLSVLGPCAPPSPWRRARCPLCCPGSMSSPRCVFNTGMKVPVCWGRLAVPSLGPGVGTGIASVFFTCLTPASRPCRAQGAPEGKWGGSHRGGEAASLAEAAGHLPCSHTPAPSFWNLWRLRPVCCRCSLGPPCWSCWPGRCHGGPSGEGRPAGAAADLGPVLWEQVGRRRDSPHERPPRAG